MSLLKIRGRGMFPMLGLLLLAICWSSQQSVIAQDSAGSPSPLGRYLLVASEGLYVVDTDGHCSWSYNPEPYKGQGWVTYDDLVYDGWALPGDRFLYSTHRYVREVDRAQKTIWEYRVQGTTEVKTCVPLPNGRVAVLNSQEQAILELEPLTGKVLHRIAVPAKGGDHTRYTLLRSTPEGNYLVALRTEQRFLEISGEGREIRSFPVTGFPVVAQRLSDGGTLCAGGFGLVRLDPAGNNVWSFTKEDAAPHFPLIYASGFVELPNGRLLVANSDWHYTEKDQNRSQAFVVDAEKKIEWTLPATEFGKWKLSETEPRTGLIEHRVCRIQPLP